MTSSIRTFIYVALSFSIILFAMIGILFVFDIGSVSEYKNAIMRTLSVIGIITGALVILALLNSEQKK